MNGGKPELILIAAIARDRVIGKDNALLWHLPEDMKHFRDLTRGNSVIMGRKTWQSLPERFRPLPDRHNIVLTRDPGFLAPGAQLAVTLDDALAACSNASQAFIIGGAEIYALALPRADRMELTEIAADFSGDAWFPPWNPTEWIEQARETHRHETAGGGWGYAFVSYRRKVAPGTG